MVPKHGQKPDIIDNCRIYIFFLGGALSVDPNNTFYHIYSIYIYIYTEEKIKGLKISPIHCF